MPITIICTEENDNSEFILKLGEKEELYDLIIDIHIKRSHLSRPRLTQCRLNGRWLKSKKIPTSFKKLGIRDESTVSVLISTAPPRREKYDLSPIIAEIELELEKENKLKNSVSAAVKEKKPVDSNKHPPAHLERAENGDADAQYEMGKYCISKKEIKNAVEWFELSAHQQHSGAQNQLLLIAQYYKSGEFIEKNPIEAARIYQFLALRENKIAQFNLENWDQMGLGVIPDLTESSKWYKKAVEKGCNLALPADAEHDKSQRKIDKFPQSEFISASSSFENFKLELIRMKKSTENKNKLLIFFLNELDKEPKAFLNKFKKFLDKNDIQISAMMNQYKLLWNAFAHLIKKNAWDKDQKIQIELNKIYSFEQELFHDLKSIPENLSKILIAFVKKIHSHIINCRLVIDKNRDGGDYLQQLTKLKDSNSFLLEINKICSYFFKYMSADIQNKLSELPKIDKTLQHEINRLARLSFAQAIKLNADKEIKKNRAEKELKLISVHRALYDLWLSACEKAELAIKSPESRIKFVMPSLVTLQNNLNLLENHIKTYIRASSTTNEQLLVLVELSTDFQSERKRLEAALIQLMENQFDEKLTLIQSFPATGQLTEIFSAVKKDLAFLVTIGEKLHYSGDLIQKVKMLLRYLENPTAETEEVKKTSHLQIKEGILVEKYNHLRNTLIAAYDELILSLDNSQKLKSFCIPDFSAIFNKLDILEVQMRQHVKINPSQPISDRFNEIPGLKQLEQDIFLRLNEMICSLLPLINVFSQLGLKNLDALFGPCLEYLRKVFAKMRNQKDPGLTIGKVDNLLRDIQIESTKRNLIHFSVPFFTFTPSSSTHHEEKKLHNSTSSKHYINMITITVNCREENEDVLIISIDESIKLRELIETIHHQRPVNAKNIIRCGLHKGWFRKDAINVPLSTLGIKNGGILRFSTVAGKPEHDLSILHSPAAQIQTKISK